MVKNCLKSFLVLSTVCCWMHLAQVLASFPRIIP
jgi:hypothetical protein